MDYNATTSLEPEVIEAVTEALRDAWGNPSSNYTAGEEYYLIKLVFISIGQLSLSASQSAVWTFIVSQCSNNTFT